MPRRSSVFLSLGVVSRAARNGSASVAVFFWYVQKRFNRAASMIASRSGCRNQRVGEKKMEYRL